MRRSSVCLACVLLAVVASAGCEPQAKRRPDAEPNAVVTADAETASARFQATIYEVRVPADRIGALDAGVLVAQAATPEDLEKALSAVGRTRAVYAIDQTVSLAKDRIHLGKREPFVTNTRVAQAGRRMNMIQYEDVGVIFAIAGQPGDAGLDVAVEIEMSALTDSATQVAEGVSAMTVRQVVLGRNGAVRLGRPEVLIGADASTQDADGNAVAYVCRLVFSEAGP